MFLFDNYFEFKNIEPIDQLILIFLVNIKINKFYDYLKGYIDLV